MQIIKLCIAGNMHDKQTNRWINMHLRKWCVTCVWLKDKQTNKSINAICNWLNYV